LCEFQKFSSLVLQYFSVRFCIISAGDTQFGRMLLCINAPLTFPTAVLAARPGLTDILGLGAEELRNAGHQVLAITCDVTEQTVTTFGKLDMAYNNAGIINQHKNTDNFTIEEWERIMSINLRGVWNCMKYELKQML
jgi:hypothetical protein